MAAVGTLAICIAVTPTVIGTTVSHYINRRPRRMRPTAHIGYDLGLNLVRTFIEYMSRHTVEEIQGFTQQWVPAPRWVKTTEIEISHSYSVAAANHLVNQLGPKGVAEVGGSKWWQWRKDEAQLKAEWIEMRSDYSERKVRRSKGSRVLLYIHGGAYYFGSVDEHRYQIQRHARKLKARCLAPRYRLAPQFPFPCGLHDTIAAYLYLLSEYEAKNILVAGDSAGGGMIASLLVTLRDQNLPLPAGGILISPWVDLTHSFPSICMDAQWDYIPTQGFVHRPSVGWPPARLDLQEEDVQHTGEDAELGSPLTKRYIKPDWIPDHVPDQHIIPRLELEDKVILIKDQIQMYAPNHMLLHPLVSPVLNPSLGGLCPLLVQVGGGELLRDEQVYFAHKAADPAAYPPHEEVLARYDPDGSVVTKYPPTNVHLQIWDDVCHVPHTLSWTRPAKFMYRSVAQFGAWALARAQKVPIEIDDGESTSGSEEEDDAYASAAEGGTSPSSNTKSDDQENFQDCRERGPVTTTYDRIEKIGRAGDPLPPFTDHMIRQRVDRHGNIYPLSPPMAVRCLQLKPHDIGQVKEAAVHKWLERQNAWDKKHANRKTKLRAQRAKMEAKGMPPALSGEHPPPTALVRRWIGECEERGRKMAGGDEGKRKQLGVGLKWWSGWGSKHDQRTLEQTESTGSPSQPVLSDQPRRKSSAPPQHRRKISVVADQGQADRLAISTTNSPTPASPLPIPARGSSIRPHETGSPSGLDARLSSGAVSPTNLDEIKQNLDRSRPSHERFQTAKEEL